MKILIICNKLTKCYEGDYEPEKLAAFIKQEFDFAPEEYSIFESSPIEVKEGKTYRSSPKLRQNRSPRSSNLRSSQATFQTNYLQSLKQSFASKWLKLKNTWVLVMRGSLNSRLWDHNCWSILISSPSTTSITRSEPKVDWLFYKWKNQIIMEENWEIMIQDW